MCILIMSCILGYEIGCNTLFKIKSVVRGFETFGSGSPDVIKFFVKLHNIYILLHVEGPKEHIFEELSALVAKPMLAFGFGTWQQQRKVLLASTLNVARPQTVVRRLCSTLDHALRR
jgi:hypothetical protein